MAPKGKGCLRPPGPSQLPLFARLLGLPTRSTFSPSPMVRRHRGSSACVRTATGRPWETQWGHYAAPAGQSAAGDFSDPPAAAGAVLPRAHVPPSTEPSWLACEGFPPRPRWHAPGPPGSFFPAPGSPPGTQALCTLVRFIHEVHILQRPEQDSDWGGASTCRNADALGFCASQIPSHRPGTAPSLEAEGGHHGDVTAQPCALELVI